VDGVEHGRDTHEAEERDRHSGESEATLVDLMVKAPLGEAGDVQGVAFFKDGEVVATPMRHHIEDLDTLEVAWHLLDWDDYHYNIEPCCRMASVLTSRGCMMGCSLCSQRLFWRGDWRARKPENVVAEMRYLVDTYQVEFITLIDAYPTHDLERWERILDLLIEEKLPVHLLIETRVEDIIRDADILQKYHDAGIIHVYLGAETSTDDMLNSLDKGTTVDQNKQAIKVTIAEAIRLNPRHRGVPGHHADAVHASVERDARPDPRVGLLQVQPRDAHRRTV